MNWLADNALAIWMGGAVALTMALVVYFQTRSGKALLGILAVLAVTAALLVTERVVETPREQVERTLYQLAAAVEANDVEGALAHITPNAVVRKEVETLMPLVKIERARIIGTPQINFDPNGAVVKCRGLIVARVKHSGMKGAADDELTIAFVRYGDRWLLQDYYSNRNWQRALGR